MKKFFLIYFFLLLFSLSAQDLFFCKSVSDLGQPIDSELNWKIEPYGTSISILYKSKTRLESKILYMFIDKKSGDDYKPFDSKSIKPDGTKNWLEFEFKFREEGDYEIYIMNSDKQILAVNYLTASFSDSYNSDKKSSETSYSYYDNAKIIFCERVFSNKPLNSFRTASTSQNVFVFIDSQKPLNTDVILVYIYKKKNRAFEYDNFVASKRFKVNSKWNNTFFKYKFNEPGEYKISVFNKNEKLIINGFLKVR